MASSAIALFIVLTVSGISALSEDLPPTEEVCSTYIPLVGLSNYTESLQRCLRLPTPGSAQCYSHILRDTTAGQAVWLDSPESVNDSCFALQGDSVLEMNCSATLAVVCPDDTDECTDNSVTPRGSHNCVNPLTTCVNTIGSYYCNCSLPGTPDSNSTDGSDCYSEPVLVQYTEDDSYAENTQVVIACTFDSYPRASVTWYREVLDLSMGPDATPHLVQLNHTISGHTIETVPSTNGLLARVNSSLTLPNASRLTSGRYRCAGSIAVHDRQINTSRSIDVINSVTIATQPPTAIPTKLLKPTISNVSAGNGGSHSIHCSVESEMSVDLEWRDSSPTPLLAGRDYIVEQKPLTYDNKRRLYSNSLTLTILKPAALLEDFFCIVLGSNKQIVGSAVVQQTLDKEDGNSSLTVATQPPTAIPTKLLKPTISDISGGNGASHSIRCSVESEMRVDLEWRDSSSTPLLAGKDYVMEQTPSTYDNKRRLYSNSLTLYILKPAALLKDFLCTVLGSNKQIVGSAVVPQALGKYDGNSSLISSPILWLSLLGAACLVAMILVTASLRRRSRGSSGGVSHALSSKCSKFKHHASPRKIRSNVAADALSNTILSPKSANLDRVVLSPQSNTATRTLSSELVMDSASIVMVERESPTSATRNVNVQPRASAVSDSNTHATAIPDTCPFAFPDFFPA